MKLQHLAIIFVIIILPISLVIGEYIGAQIDTIYIQTQYNTRLQNAAYDAIKAFQLNTTNNKYSSVSDSKIRDIEASINTFYNSLGTAMGSSGYDKEELQEYIPAIVYTMYDGYYIYGKYYNYYNYGDDNDEDSDGDYQYGLKPYIYYACRYVRGSDDFVVNYTLDNSITIYGNIDNKYVTKSGYLINPSLVKNIEIDGNGYAKSVEYDGLTIEREILTEQLITVDDNGVATKGEYQYTFYNNQKIYKDGENYFLYKNNSKEYLTDEGKVLQNGEVTDLMYAKFMTDGEDLYSNSAVEYYVKAKEFSEWVQNNIGNITQENAVDSNGEKITDFATNTGSEKIFSFDEDNDPLLEGSVFNENRISVIRKSIETNLASAIANYNAGSGGTYEFQMPIFTEEDWDKVLNNISISVFMQGIPIKAKYYNNYCIITNDKNEEVVTEDSIYVLAENSNGIIEAHMPNCKVLIDNGYDIIGAYSIIDFLQQTVVVSTDNEVYYYPHADQKCYNCIVNITQTYEINDIIKGQLKEYDASADEYKDITNKLNSTQLENFEKLRKTYLSALGRTRYDLYRTNGNLND
jgi:hypothetical protein